MPEHSTLKPVDLNSEHRGKPDYRPTWLGGVYSPGDLYPPGDLNPPCPVTTLAYQTLSSAHTLTHMLRRLRLSMINCCSCRANSHCPLLADFNAQLSRALQEVADEWSLA